jgi:hypothetical protein
LLQEPTRGEIFVSGGQISYRSKGTSVGSETLQFYAEDQLGAVSTEETLTIIINNGEPSPTHYEVVFSEAGYEPEHLCRLDSGRMLAVGDDGTWVIRNEHFNWAGVPSLLNANVDYYGCAMFGSNIISVGRLKNSSSGNKGIATVLSAGGYFHYEFGERINAITCTDSSCILVGDENSIFRTQNTDIFEAATKNWTGDVFHVETVTCSSSRCIAGASSNGNNRQALYSIDGGSSWESSVTSNLYPGEQQPSDFLFMVENSSRFVALTETHSSSQGGKSLSIANAINGDNDWDIDYYSEDLLPLSLAKGKERGYIFLAYEKDAEPKKIVIGYSNFGVNKWQVCTTNILGDDGGLLYDNYNNSYIIASDNRIYESIRLQYNHHWDDCEIDQNSTDNDNPSPLVPISNSIDKF